MKHLVTKSLSENPPSSSKRPPPDEVAEEGILRAIRRYNAERKAVKPESQNKTPAAK